jgi:hypothetical protein
MKRLMKRMSTGVALLAVLLLALGCGRGQSSLSAADQAAMAPFVGVWEDTETNSLTTVKLKSAGVTVLSVIGSDGEEYPVKQQSWTGTGLTWSYFVTSTGYLVNIVADGVEDGRMHYTWSNHEASGEDYFVKSE